jgi:hypothetical protein
VSEPEDEEIGTIGMRMHSIEFLTSLANKGLIRSLIQSGMVPLITSVASYLILSNKQENNQIAYQIINVNNEIVYIHSERNYCKDFILQIIENVYYNAVEAILLVAEKFLLSIEESKELSVEKNFDDIHVMQYTYNCPSKDYGLKKREVTLYILGSLSDDKVKYRYRKGASKFSLDYLFESIALPDFKMEIFNLFKRPYDVM